ncbi:hypothetical protein [Paracoccus acridae]|uniref:hypothetical protein n=1 Tax=Paracoccus acridae TaxID=1795310 RepID=UPI00166827AE|nr:hypothetical protein [Paracoccus acridae]
MHIVERRIVDNVILTHPARSREGKFSRDFERPVRKTLNWLPPICVLTPSQRAWGFIDDQKLQGFWQKHTNPVVQSKQNRSFIMRINAVGIIQTGL